MNLLLIEDDHTLAQNITEALRAEQAHVKVVYDGMLAERLLRKEAFDCVIMDVNLPGKNGFELCKAYRQFNKSTPVIMLTAFAELEDKVTGFDAGADDYLTKPFYMRELYLRIQNLVKRSRQLQEEVSSNLAAGDVVINDDQKKVYRGQQEIMLTPREYQILYMLIDNKDRVVSKAELMKEIWGGNVDYNTNTIEVYINFLRNKIDKPFGQKSIKTKVGYGYYWDMS
ncbi:response regulator transcription factor [Niabella yanshanensis]|uniref:Response regulator transcription factor n=1 Tax=Niabella yanshanensis TaxID=577386 RepID=A0ABZ0W8G8_9BACT|nr:response regulator transcription factor [Niabella yanshanensis]WQD39588.1 response regulator transcription factor [Niabella yanshanensis]